MLSNKSKNAALFHNINISSGIVHKGTELAAEFSVHLKLQPYGALQIRLLLLLLS